MTEHDKRDMDLSNMVCAQVTDVANQIGQLCDPECAYGVVLFGMVLAMKSLLNALKPPKPVAELEVLVHAVDNFIAAQMKHTGGHTAIVPLPNRTM